MYKSPKPCFISVVGQYTTARAIEFQVPVTSCVEYFYYVGGTVRQYAAAVWHIDIASKGTNRYYQIPVMMFASRPDFFVFSRCYGTTTTYLTMLFHRQLLTRFINATPVLNEIYLILILILSTITILLAIQHIASTSTSTSIVSISMYDQQYYEIHQFRSSDTSIKKILD